MPDRGEERGVEPAPGGPAREPAPAPVPETGDGVWPYVGVGCLTAGVGLVGGGMLGVLVATVVAGLNHCQAADNGAPCDWNIYWTWGARIGVLLLPTLALWRLWRGRHRTQNTNRG